MTGRWVGCRRKPFGPISCDSGPDAPHGVDWITAAGTCTAVFPLVLGRSAPGDRSWVCLDLPLTCACETVKRADGREGAALARQKRQQRGRETRAGGSQPDRCWPRSRRVGKGLGCGLCGGRGMKSLVKHRASMPCLGCFALCAPSPSVRDRRCCGPCRVLCGAGGAQRWPCALPPWCPTGHLS